MATLITISSQSLLYSSLIPKLLRKQLLECPPRSTGSNHLVLWVVRTQGRTLLFYHTLEPNPLWEMSALFLIREFLTLLEIPTEIPLVPVQLLLVVAVHAGDGGVVSAVNIILTLITSEADDLNIG